MGAILYMCARRIKNNLLDLRRQPGKLILVLILVGTLVFSLFAPTEEQTGGVLRSMDEFYAIVFALYLLIFGLCAYSGFGTGASMFSMPDVTLLFPSPVRPKTVLTYGLVRQLGVAAVACFFLIYQYSWLHQLYGITPLILLCVLFGFMLVVFASQLLAMLIYSATCGQERKKGICKGIFLSLFAAVIVAAAVCCLRMEGALLDRVVRVTASDLLALFPVAGWCKGMVAALLTGAPLRAILWAVPLAAAIGGMIFLIRRVGADFYEDVLAATEVAQSAITAKKENGGMDQFVKKNVRVGKIGIGAGEGASAIYHKLRVENRRARFLLIDTMSFIFLAIDFAFIIILSMGAAADTPADTAQLAIICGLSMSAYMQLFTTAMGPFARELRLPYIYMLPDPPFRKLLQCIRVQLPGFLLEGVLLWVPLMLILKLPVPDTLLCILVRISFSLLYVSTNTLVERFFGGLPKLLLTGVYFLVSIVCTLPAIVVGVAVGIACDTVGITLLSPALGALCGCNLAIGALLLFAARNMLDCAEVNRT